MDLTHPITAADLLPKIDRMWEHSASKIRSIESVYDGSSGAPVFTVEGKYTARGWTDWTEGFIYGSSILQFDATGESSFLDLGRKHTVERMPAHVTHVGVHDHGFNNVSTFGNLLRLMKEGKIPEDVWQRNYNELALMTSGAVQATRWTSIPDGGYVYSFNGPHSLFSDTIRSMRALAVAHMLGHTLRGEQDQKVSLLARMIAHIEATLQYNVYYGENRDGYDVAGRVVHESIFNPNNGDYRCPSTQQGYSPFSTWTRGLAWVMCGCAEQLEYLQIIGDDELDQLGGRASVEAMLLRAARVTCDFYIESAAAACGIPYWDTGAPGLVYLKDWTNRRADPFNDYEPVDSSAAAIAAQGLLRLGHYLDAATEGAKYWQAGLKVVDTLLGDLYLSTDPQHQGLLLHGVYHWPNHWDHVPSGKKIACGESVMWGDYHLRELALYVSRVARSEEYLTFFNIASSDEVMPQKQTKL
ncbi:MAG: glycosyl hydrolase [Rhodothermales bacterium]|nr:glycosyl hydrolase [Rhodothermales bacterium]